MHTVSNPDCLGLYDRHESREDAQVCGLGRKRSRRASVRRCP